MAGKLLDAQTKKFTAEDGGGNASDDKQSAQK